MSLVEAQRQARVPVLHRLGAALAEIDDLQPPVAERNAPLLGDTHAIGSAGSHRARHRVHAPHIRVAIAKDHFSTQAAHIRAEPPFAIIDPKYIGL